ncbi:MAG: rhodanese-like domain-containing protein [Pseudomonadota bacterium]
MEINQLIEFSGNHPALVFALFALLAMLIGGELRQRLSGVSEVGPGEAIRLLNHDNAVMIDMRSDKEYGDGHVANAIHVPSADKLTALEKYRGRPVIVYCNSGNRSTGFCSRLRKDGFENVYNLRGGILGWQKAELPLARK